jgi:hypothetical protein
VSYYELLLFLHVAAAILWIGGSATLQLIGLHATSTDDHVALAKLFDAGNWLATRLFIPSSLAVLVLGILLTIEGPWSPTWRSSRRATTSGRWR